MSEREVGRPIGRVPLVLDDDGFLCILCGEPCGRRAYAMVEFGPRDGLVLSGPVCARCFVDAPAEGEER